MLSFFCVLRTRLLGVAFSEDSVLVEVLRAPRGMVSGFLVERRILVLFLGLVVVFLVAKQDLRQGKGLS